MYSLSPHISTESIVYMYNKLTPEQVRQNQCIINSYQQSHSTWNKFSRISILHSDHKIHVQLWRNWYLHLDSINCRIGNIHRGQLFQTYLRLKKGPSLRYIKIIYLWSLTVKYEMQQNVACCIRLVYQTAHERQLRYNILQRAKKVIILIYDL